MDKTTRRKFIKRGLLASFGLVVLDMFWFEKFIIDWNYFDVSKDKGAKIKIVQLSDLHLKKVRYVHEGIADKINEIQPDIILITGDAIDSRDHLEVLDKFLGLIDHSIVKYAIPGNWEYWGYIDLKELDKVYHKHNCLLMVNHNRSLKIRDREISIIGVDDLVGGKADFRMAANNLESEDTVIVMTHCPEHRDYIVREKGELDIDLILSGHTHGGQITLFGWAPFRPVGSGEYLKGWYKDQSPPLYVSKGIGTSIVPMRFFSRAEVAVFEV